MRFAKYIVLIVSLLAFSSCEDVVQIKLDEGSKLYVVDAFINNLREDQKVRVVTNDSYFSNQQAPAVTNAAVVLTDLTTNTSFNFNYTSNGYYVYALASTDTIAKTGHQYKLSVTIDGEEYTSLAVQKRAAVIDSIGFVYNDGQFGPHTPDTTYTALLFARDKADDNPDYYWVKTFRNDTLFNGSDDINICIDGTGGPVVGAPQDTIDFTPPSTFLSFKSYRKNNKCKVEVHSITRDTYFFFLQSLNQINNQGLFATTPENVRTNITTPEKAATKAVGWFSVASVASREKVLK